MIFLVKRKFKIFGIAILAFLLLVSIVSASQESQALVKKGVDLHNAKQYDDAISNFDKAIGLDPQDADAWYHKGVDLDLEFKSNEANVAMDHALLLNPNNSMYNMGKSLILIEQGKYDDAEGYADKSLMLDPNNAFGWDAKGIIDQAKGDTAGAIFDYKRAIKLYPEDTPALKALYKLEHP